MKRTITLFAVAGLLAAMPLSHLALGAKGGNSNKVAICHIPDDAEIVDPDGIPGTGDESAAGHVILVSGNGNAVDAHLAHGDCLAADGALKGDDCTCAAPAPAE
jgi:hypothetical protein